VIEQEKVKFLHSEGQTITEIASDLGCSYATIYQIHKKMNLTPNRKSSTKHDRILALAKERPDLSYDEIGALVDCTRQNVSFVCLGKHFRRRESTKTKHKISQSNKV
jgi:transposase